MKQSKNGIPRLTTKTVKVDTEKLVEYTAMVSKNYRNTVTGARQVLLRGVMTEDDEEFRDHCWVNESKELLDMLETKHATRNQGSYVIQFKAVEKKYNYRNTGTFKKTLDHICDVKVLGRA